MPLRPMSALCILLLAGCTTSEPQNTSYAPPPPQTATAMPAPSPAFAPPPTAYHQTISAGGPATSTGETTAQTDNPLEATNLPPGATNCHTVDDVTLCDAPSDPNADTTRYTN